LTIQLHAKRILQDLKRFHRAKTIGVVVGICGGWFGAIIGLGIGWMIDAILSQGRTDRAILAYLENPGPSSFTETIPGSAAFCALASLVAEAPEGPLTASRIAGIASDIFMTGEGGRAEMETFARIAASRSEVLNPDLLMESLIARRKNLGNDNRIRTAICDALESLATGPYAHETVERLSILILPHRALKRVKNDTDPYRILGIGTDATVDEAKAVYRRLAAQFHPDVTAGLDEGQRKSAAEAFLRIDDAYRKILGTASA
jgi:hypothetical protein